MIFLKNRLATFKTWPIEDEPGCICTAEKMAESGFFSCANEEELDLTRCNVCLKELEGWEAEDNPLEARYHNKHCLIPKMKKTASKYTTEDIIKLINCQQQNILRALTEETIAEFREKAAGERLKLVALGTGGPQAKKPRGRQRGKRH